MAHHGFHAISHKWHIFNEMRPISQKMSIMTTKSCTMLVSIHHHLNFVTTFQVNLGYPVLL